jgi:hypothetical protein
MVRPSVDHADIVSGAVRSGLLRDETAPVIDIGRLRYAPTSHPYGWAAFAQAVWNTMSGVVEVASEIVSVVWSVALAAAAYIGGAAARRADDLGLGPLVTQAAHFLHEVASAMEWALNKLLDDVIIPIINAVLTAALRPVIAAEKSYAEAVDFAVDPAGSPAIWGAVGWPPFQFGFAAVLAAEVVMTLVLATMSVDVWPLLTGILVGGIVTAASAILPAFVSMSPSLAST